MRPHPLAHAFPALALPLAPFARALALAMMVLPIAAAHAQPAPDRDADGKGDDRDACPDEPEDMDGFDDLDGCPDDDNDGDLVPDAIDSCATQPETFNGFEDTDGCPDAIPSPPPASTGCGTGPLCKAAGDAAWQRADFDLAFESYRRACALRDSGGCGALATTTDLGRGPRFPIEATHACYRFACAHRVKEACFNRGLMVRDGRGIPPNPTYAKVLFGRACDLGDSNACALLGRPAPVAPPVAPTSTAPTTAPTTASTAQVPSAPPAPQAAPERNDPLLTQVEARFDAKDYRGALKLGTPACDRGAFDVCAILGTARWELGQPKDARKLWDKACTGKVGWACTELAKNAATDGLADEMKALAFAERGCELGDADGCELAGNAALSFGQDGVRWFARGCDLRSVSACSAAASGYTSGLLGGTKDPGLAAKYGAVACELGSRADCAVLVKRFCARGAPAHDATRCRGVAQRGCELGDSEACKASRAP